jgi:hypothetical protein
MADPLNFQLPPEGFDSYLVGIIPDDQAVLAGAFSTAMQQVRNIQSVDIQQFAQVAYSMENMAGLPFTAGTDVPTDLALATFAKSQTALGAGVYGTFTNSNFFGCMSGLPYPLKAIYDGIKQLETPALKTIYQNLYLAVQWDPAGNATVTYTDDGFGNYTFTGVSYAQGGGYGRDGNPAPTISIAGAAGNFIIGTDPNDLSTYGKIIGDTFAPSGTTTSPTFTVAIPNPPGGNWTTVNNEILGYVNDANTEILAIKNASASNFRAANILDTNWNITGTALKQEQRARYNFAPPVPIPYDRWLTVAPVALYVFVDSIPDLSKKTLPHMAAQTLEHISNLRNTGGQSVVGMMRQERNQERLQQIGIELDNNIPDTIPEQIQKMLLTNGTVPLAVDGVPSSAGKFYTTPAWPTVDLPVSGNPCDDNVVTAPVSPDPVAIFDVNIQVLREVTQTTEGNISAILENDCLGPFGNGTGPLIFDAENLPPGLGPPRSACGDLTEELAEELGFTPCVDNNGEIPIVLVNTRTPVGDTPILGLPEGTPTTPTGLPETPSGIPGFINLQPPVSILPPNLNTAYTGTTLIPSTYNVPDAIDKVIECNCDCWIG